MTAPQEPQPEPTPSAPGSAAPEGAAPGSTAPESATIVSGEAGADRTGTASGDTPTDARDASAEASVDSPADTTAEAPVGGRRGRRGRNKPKKTAMASAIEWVVVIGGAIVLAIVVKAFLLQAFYIPSASMYPTLQKGDRVLVNKLSYRLHDVNRGDVVVFERPPSETATDIPDLIKRVVGLPGEQIVIEGGHVYADGKLLDEPYLPEGVTTTADNTPYRCTRDDPCQVPDGDVWVMGDNRNDSKDSRYFGPIEESSIVGRAFVVVWPLDRLGLL